MMVSKLLLLSIVFGCVFGASIPSFLQPHVATFVIEPGTKDKISVQLAAASVSATCKFEYDTNIVEEVKKGGADFVPAKVLIEQMNKKYKCINHEENGFEYEICLGAEISQKANNGDRYTLGAFERVDESSNTQLYTKGTYCEAAHAGRKAVVEFTCGDSVSVTAINENAICQYRIIVAVPEVCGHPQFTGVVTKAETWVLELTETDEGSVICQAYNNGLDSVGTLTFQTFSLGITNSNYDLTKYVIRNKARKAVGDSSLVKAKSPATISIAKKMQIDYAKIVAA